MGISLGLPRSRVRLNNETAYSLCQDIVIQGLKIEQSGGDAIIVEQCQRVHIADVHADGNYRQGMSIIGAKDMLVERCNFSNTCATSWLRILHCCTRRWPVGFTIVLCVALQKRNSPSRRHRFGT